MSQPLVTIVTPSLNQGRFIRATIESVLAQSYPNIEYIVMDGGSTDETAAVVAEYADRLTWVSELDRGQAHAINKGFRRARGEIVGWLNSDDLLLPDAVERAVAAFAEDRRRLLVYGDAAVMDELGHPTGYLVTGTPDPWELANGADYIVQPAAFFQREAVEAVGMVDECLHFTLDWELLIRLSNHGPSHHIPACMAWARVYDEAKTFSGGRPRWREIRRVIARHADSRYPPVFFLYGIDSARMIAFKPVRRLLRRARLDPMMPVALLEIMLFSPLEALIPARRRRQPDGWIGRQAVEWLAGEGDAIELRGYVPPVFSRRWAQRLRLELDGEPLGAHRLDPGSFRLVVRTPAANGSGRLRMRARRSFVPRWRRASADKRRLGLRVLEARRLPAGDVDVWRIDGAYDDGWAAPRVTVELEPHGRRIRIRGRVVDMPALEGNGAQHIAVTGNGRVLSLNRLPVGPFEIDVPAQPESERLVLELEAERTVTFDEGTAEPREVAFMLDGVELVR